MSRALLMALVVGSAIGAEANSGQKTARKEADAEAPPKVANGSIEANQRDPVRPPAEDLDNLAEYASAHRQDPVEYVVKKFETHEIVFIGEHHYIKHDVEFVQSLIPVLYGKGVRNLGIEFGCYGDQGLVDQLVTAPEYDEELARRLMFRCFVEWGYKEYLELYRAAWRLNTHLGQGQPKFRIVHLMPKYDWSQLTGNDLRPLERLKVKKGGFGETKMGRVILDEFVAKGQKALVYMGWNHAQTRYDLRKGWQRFLLPAKPGRLVYEKIGDGAFLILLHAPWRQRNGDFAPPVGGVIDAVFNRRRAYPTGFDTRGTPFGNLPDRDCIYAPVDGPFTLQDICDGYIFMKPLNEYEMVTVDEHFIHEGNLKEAIAQIPDLDERKKCRSVADVLALIQEQAKSMFRGMGPHK